MERGWLVGIDMVLAGHALQPRPVQAGVGRLGRGEEGGHRHEDDE